MPEVCTGEERCKGHRVMPSVCSNGVARGLLRTACRLRSKAAPGVQGWVLCPDEVARPGAQLQRPQFPHYKMKLDFTSWSLGSEQVRQCRRGGLTSPESPEEAKPELGPPAQGSFPGVHTSLRRACELLCIAFRALR